VKGRRGSLVTRLGRLEGRPAAPRPAEPDRRDEAGWLAAFERLGREGYMDAEPDFPAALAEMRDALARARASTDPPFDPPSGFMPGHPNPHLRAECWRSAARFPELSAAMDWLFEMVGRVAEGEPPVSEAEFAELAAWFAAHDAEIAKVEPLEAGGGHRVWCASVRDDLARGPRAIGSGRVAEDVRRLKARRESFAHLSGPGV
jgi:hypothetical protein